MLFHGLILMAWAAVHVAAQNSSIPADESLLLPLEVAGAPIKEGTGFTPRRALFPRASVDCHTCDGRPTGVKVDCAITGKSLV